MPDTAFVFSTLDDPIVALAAQADLVGDAIAAGEKSDSFFLAFGGMKAASAHAGRVWLVARDGELIIGLVSLVIDAAITLPGVAQVKGIITKNACRRKGIASQLLQLAGELAASNGKSIVTIETAVGNHPALFFQKSGFAINSIEPGFATMPGGSITDTVTYWKRFNHPL